MFDTQMTIERYVRHVAPTLWAESGERFDTERVLSWPPDAFALAAGLLSASGGYTHVLDRWPPEWTGARSARSWEGKARAVGKAWRRHASEDAPPPPDVEELVERVVDARSMQVGDIAGSRQTAHALLALMIYADEACVGVGVPTDDLSRHDTFVSLAFLRMLETRNRTLCNAIDPAHLGVLPKMRTPQSGLTLRSLTHHLALYSGLEVTPTWWQTSLPRQDRWRALLVPWPLRMSTSQFRRASSRIGIADGFGCFSYWPEGRPREVEEHLARIVAKAREKDDVDCLVLPECALNAGQFDRVERLALRERLVLVTGVAVAPTGDGFGGNEVRIRTPTASGQPLAVGQAKHHRWRLGGGQIRQYGLQDALAPDKEWWEGFGLRPRKVHFVAASSRLSFCALICEDLARLDPVSHVVRSVAPNLVIALLLDGPQLGARWPARYATVLAEDPGCSVLTLTSLGMAVRCINDPETGEPVYDPSRVIALWKNGGASQPREIVLEDDAEAVVLNIEWQSTKEWSADGRRKSGAAVVPVLGTPEQVRL